MLLVIITVLLCTGAGLFATIGYWITGKSKLVKGCGRVRKECSKRSSERCEVCGKTGNDA